MFDVRQHDRRLADHGNRLASAVITGLVSRIDVVDSGHVLGRQKVVARLTGSEIWTNDAPWTPAADVRFGTKGGKIRDRLHHGRKRRRHADISRGSKMCLAIHLVVVHLSAEGRFDRSRKADAVLAARNTLHSKAVLPHPRLHLGDVGIRQPKARAKFVWGKPLGVEG